MVVQRILSDEHLRELLKDNQQTKKLVLVMFFLESSKSCEGLDKTYMKMSNVFKSAEFFQVSLAFGVSNWSIFFTCFFVSQQANPDKCSKSVIEYGISHLPTVFALREGAVLGVVKVRRRRDLDTL